MNEITSLVEDAIISDEYKFRMNLLVAGLISEEANDTEEKVSINEEHLKKIAEFAKEYETEGEKKQFLLRTAARIQGYLSEQ